MKVQVKDLKPGDVFFAGPDYAGHQNKAVVQAVVPVRFRVELWINAQPHEVWLDGDKFVELAEEKA